MKFKKMRSIIFYLIFLSSLLTIGCREHDQHEAASVIVGTGKMPNLLSSGNSLSIVYGTGDSIMFTSSSDRGETFSSPQLIAILPQLLSSHMRGPQISGNENSLTVIACNKPGDIFSYTKDNSGNWSPGNRVNDIDTASKEALMSLSADGNNTFAVWLDLRDGKNKIFGSHSSDAGKTWSKNKLIYASPDGTVCECCKPSVLVNGDQVNVMFRNWLNGNRDLYLIQSENAGLDFGVAKKLGVESWALNGCPMDGGGIAIGDDKKLHTVWRRQGKIYSCEPGEKEIEIGTGKACNLTVVGSQTIYTWTENGEIICLLPNAGRKVIGKGQSPVIKPISNDKVAFVFESENQITAKIIHL